MISFRFPGFGGPKVKQPPAPPPPPEPEPLPPVAEMPDEGDVLAREQRRRKRAATSKTGRLSTILSDSFNSETLG